jgi:septum site-determining protein MinC
MEGAISIKGTREGLTITLGSGDTQQLYDDLSRHLKLQGAFFRGGIVALDVGARSMDVQHLCSFRDLLSQHTMTLRTVVTADPTTLGVADEMGLRAIGAEAPAEPELQPPAPAPVKPQPVARPPLSPGPALPPAAPIAQDNSRGLILKRRLRAGQIVRHSGSVVIIGDVNVGAEIIAGGDVVVWGKLRGTVHAGYPNDDSAMVCALDLAPLQLRLGGFIARPEETAAERGSVYPEVGHVRDGAIVVERWTGNQWGN